MTRFFYYNSEDGRVAFYSEDRMNTPFSCIKVTCNKKQEAMISENWHLQIRDGELIGIKPQRVEKQERIIQLSKALIEGKAENTQTILQQLLL